MKIRIKSGDCPSYLTVGKVYEVVDTLSFNHVIPEYHDFLPIIIDDIFDAIYTKLNGCIHLKGGSWEIVND